MEIKQETLYEFLKIMELGEVYTALLDFAPEGLKMKTMVPSTTHFATGILKIEAFENYKPIGHVGVDNLPKLISIIKSLGTTIKISKEGNLAILESSKKHLEFDLVDEKYIPEVRDLPSIKYKTTFGIEGTDMKEFVKDIKKNTDVAIIIETSENEVIIRNTRKYRFTMKTPAETAVPGIKVTFGLPLAQTFAMLKEGKLHCTIDTDKPLSASYNKDDYEINFLIAPYIKT